MKNAAPRGTAPDCSDDFDNRSPSSSARQSATSLNEPVVIAQFWRNRRGEAVRVSFEPYEGRAVLHVRQYFTDKDGKLAPTKKGVAMSIRRLPDLHKAIEKAVTVAIELGLIEDGGSA